MSSAQALDNPDSKKSAEEGFGITNIALMATCLLAGIYVGRKLNNGLRRVSTLISVGPSKMALVVRTDLNMGKGKIASQCCHATIAAYRKMEKTNPKLLQSWLDLGQPKVVLKASNLDHFENLAASARAHGVQATLVRDAGKTQIERNSATVLAVGPGAVADVDKITGDLKLL